MPYREGDPAYWPEHSCHDGCPCQRHDTDPAPPPADIPPPEPSRRGGHVLPRGSDDYRCDDPFCGRCAR